MNIEAWLREIGFEQYVEVFRENAIDADVLPELTAEDLKDLGVVQVGHRRKLLTAIAALRPAPASCSIDLPANDEINLPGNASLPMVQSALRSETPQAERRQLTIMFCDLVGSTSLAAQLDPEEVHDIISAYHRCVAATVRRFDGFVAKYMGDGVLIYFGYPQAQEGEAASAVRAGLALVEAIGKLTIGPGQLQVRIGIATGLVVVGDINGSGEAQERGVVGETPNLAARLQGAAVPGTVVIDPSTRRLTGTLFEFCDLGAISAKGFPEPVQAFRVLGEAAVASRFEALRSSRAPLVGREEELELLHRRWEQASSGSGRVVLISGEPGIGKSRLVSALEEILESNSYVRQHYFCSSHHSISPLYPVISYLEQAAGFQRGDTDENKRRRLEALLALSSSSSEEQALLSDLLLSPSSDASSLDVSPQKRKELTLAALIRQLEVLAQHGPVLMLWEDVHWIDPTSRELLELLIERVQDLPVLLIATFRPEFVSPWIGQARVTTLTLSRLERHQNAALVEQVAGGQTLPPELLQEIIARTDGVPLFIEELTKTILESGLLSEQNGRYILASPLPRLAVPATLQASLMARLDRLAPAREVAQIGAAIGREFSYELLAAVTRLPDRELQDALAQLTRAELLFARGQPPQAVYIFKHALVQDTAYAALLKSRRQDLHERIARALEESFPHVVERQPEVLADHCARAGLTQRAVGLWLKAGQRAAQHSANHEAIAHLTKALEALQRLPDEPRRDRQELEIQFALGPVLLATKGWTNPEAAQAYHRAQTLCEQLGQERERFNALWGLRYIYTAHGETEQGLELLDEMFKTADKLDDGECRLQAHHAAWASHAWLGESHRACEHIRQGLSLYDPQKHSAQALLYGGHDPGVCAKGQGSLSLWLLGYPDQAAQSAWEGLELARTLEHKTSIAHALMWAAICHQLRRDGPAALDCGDQLLKLASGHGLALYVASALAIRGWALVEEGQVENGLAELRRGLEAYAATDVKAMFSYHIAALAQASWSADLPESALAAADNALRAADEAGERFWRAEILRLRGEIALCLGTGGAEEWFVEALSIARSQSARSLQLRAGTSLARLWCNQSRREEARDLLVPIYGCFTEGLNTPDLKEAKALLNELI